MGIFSKIKEFLFGRSIVVEHHNLNSFPFDILGNKEAKSFFYKSQNVLCPNKEAIFEKFNRAPQRSHYYLDSLFQNELGKTLESAL